MEEKKTPEKEKPKMTAVVNGKVKKKGTGRRIMDAFLPEDVPDMGDYILFERLIPAVKDTFFDLGENLLSMFFYGKTGGHRRRSGGGGHVEYNRVSRSEDRPTRAARRNNDFNDILFETYGDADQVLDILMDWIDRYGQASVLDFYDASGVSSHNYTDNNYGWTDLREAQVVRARGGGYMLDLPTPRQLR